MLDSYSPPDPTPPSLSPWEGQGEGSNKAPNEHGIDNGTEFINKDRGETYAFALFFDKEGLERRERRLNGQGRLRGLRGRAGQARKVVTGRGLLLIILDGNLHLLQAVAQGVPRDVKQIRGLALIAVGLLQGPPDKALFHGLQRQIVG